MAIWFRDTDLDDLITLRYTAQVLKVRLQEVIKLGLPRYMVAKRAAYKKGDIEALLVADISTPNALLRQLQAEHEQVRTKYKTRSSRRYIPAPLLSPVEAAEARKATKANRGKPLTQDEVTIGPFAILKAREDAKAELDAILSQWTPMAPDGS